MVQRVGTEGPDRLSSSALGWDTLIGLGGDDTLVGSAGVDAGPYGDGGKDTLYGHGGNDYLYGGAGDDYLNGGTGSDRLDGGTGDDLYIVRDFIDVVVEKSAAGRDVVLAGVDFTLPDNVEDLFLDGLVRFGGGNASDNLIVGTSGQNVLYGALGDDLLDGGADADGLDGGDGRDAAVYVRSTAGVTVSLASGLGSGGDAAGDLLYNIEDIVGSDFDDTLVGNAGGNLLLGEAGDDLLDGGAGADGIDGGEGSDAAVYVTSTAGVTVSLASGLGSGGDAAGDLLYNIEDLVGSDFDDTLVGNAGGNLLLGEAGDDLLDGGAGADGIDGGEGSDAAVYVMSTAGVAVSLISGLARAAMPRAICSTTSRISSARTSTIP